MDVDMSQPATKQEVQDIVDGVLTEIRALATMVAERFDANEAEHQAMRADINRIYGHLDSIEKRLGTVEDEQQVMGYQMKRFGDWFEILAGKMDVKFQA